MKKTVLLKYLIPLLMAAAIALGFYQRTYEPHLKESAVPHFTQPSADSLEGYYQKGQEIASSSRHTTVSFLATGDIVLSRSVAATIQKSGNPDLPFEKMASILKSTDFNFANLESPVSGSNSFGRSGSMVFNAPEEYASKLRSYNFQVLNLANNHAFDQGLKGLFHTQSFLDTFGIRHVGTGSTTAEAWQPAVVEAQGVKICFIGASYASINDNGVSKNDYVARIEDKENLKLKIQNSKLGCNFVIVTMHAGTEYTRDPNQAQIDFAHAAIEDGADMVIGAHPHWVQTIERYCASNNATKSDFPSPRNGEGAGGEVESPDPKISAPPCPNPKYIFYSLGNFIFDQEWSRETKEGLALKITLSENGVRTGRDLSVPGKSTNAATLSDLQGPRQPAKLESIELIPVVIENYSTPRPATAEEAKKILGEIGETQNVLK